MKGGGTPHMTIITNIVEIAAQPLTIIMLPHKREAGGGMKP